MSLVRGTDRHSIPEVGIPVARQRRGLLGLRTLFVLLGLLVLFIAGAGLVLFRVYDNQLIRQTEAELIAQGSSVGSVFKQAVLEHIGRTQPPNDTTPVMLTGYGVAVAGAFASLHDPSLPLRPRPASLALGRDTVRPRAEPALPAAEVPDPTALAAASTLAPILRETKQTTLAGLRVVDYRGSVVASSGLELGQSLAHREEVRRALQGELTSLLRSRVSDDPAPPYSSLSRETGVRVFVALPVVEAGRVLGAVVLSRTPMTLGKAFYQDRLSLLGMVAILVVAVLAVSLLAAALIVRPVRALIRQTQAIASGQTTSRGPARSTHERRNVGIDRAPARRQRPRARWVHGRADLRRALHGWGAIDRGRRRRPGRLAGESRAHLRSVLHHKPRPGWDRHGPDHRAGVVARSRGHHRPLAERAGGPLSDHRADNSFYSCDGSGVPVTEPPGSNAMF